MKTKLTALLAALLMTSCASFEKVQPYFELAASIGTKEFLAGAKTPEIRAEYVAVVQRVGNVILTLAIGQLLTPEQFSLEVTARLPKTDLYSHFVAVIDGVYAVAYLEFKDQPDLKNDYINRIAQIILTAAGGNNVGAAPQGRLWKAHPVASSG